MDYLQTAKKAARSSGSILKSYFKSEIKRQRKSGKELVSKVDREAETEIRDIIQSEFPQHSILGEEMGEKETNSPYRWIIDPLDGTTNFLTANLFFNTSIAVAKEGEPVVGVVYNPLQDELFWAETGKGAYLNQDQIQVKATSSLEEAILTFCHGKSKRSIRRIVPIYRQMKLQAIDARQLGSAALELCYVAAGRVDAFLDNGIYPWDVAAGALIAQESGAVITDLSGDEWSLESDSILVTNSKLSDKLLKLVTEARQG